MRYNNSRKETIYTKGVIAMERDNRASTGETTFFADRQTGTAARRMEPAKGPGAAKSIANMDRIDFLTLLSESRIMDVQTGEKVFSI